MLTQPFALKVQKSEILLWLIILMIFQSKAHSTACQSKTLPEGVSTVEPCDFQEFCDATCKHNGTTLWEKQVRCLENGEWSPMPVCTHSTLPRSLEPIDCEQLPVEVRDKAFCVKIKLPATSKCPELIQIKMNMKNCSRDPNSHCLIYCGDGYSNLTCLPSGKWSYVPDCKSSRKNVCPEPEVGTLVNCSRSEGEVCKIRCPGGKIMSEDIICLSSGIWSLTSSTNRHAKNSFLASSKKSSKWTLVSKCTCPSPNLTKEFEAVDECDDKRIGEKCLLGCKNNFSMIGKKVIVCLKNASWSLLPVCSNKTCPTPELPDTLAFKEDCSSKFPKQTCKLECSENAQLILMKPFTCINGARWTKLPSCACFPPVLPERLKTEENCKEKKFGRACRLKCKGKYSISGSNLITCQTNGNWTTFPECRRNFCSKPKLPKSLIFAENCLTKNVGEACELECPNTQETYEISCLGGDKWSPFPKCSCPTPAVSKFIELKDECAEKKPGEKCEVFCKNVPTSRKRLYLTCQTNSQWNKEPSCENMTCPRPILPNYLIFAEDCNNKGIREKCNLMCKMGGNFVGEGSIKCNKRKRWSRFPKCSCADPHIQDDLENIGDCSNITPGKKCKLKCKRKLYVSGNNFIVCQNDTTWTSQPSCITKYCNEPELSPGISTKIDCSFKLVNSNCEIVCKEGGSLIGPKTITCMETLKWSPLPSCTCPELELNEFFFKSNCSDKRPGDRCKLSCKKSFKLVGNEYISCLNNTKWSSLPKCKLNICRNPELSSILDFGENCSYKSPNETCELICKQGGNIIGPKTITCLNNLEWTNLPSCTCPTPNLNDNLKVNSSCENRKISEKCFIQCKENFSNPTFPYIECMRSLKWSSQPTCKAKYCQKPDLPKFMVFDDVCSLKVPGDICVLACREEGEIIGKNEIKCLNLTAWTPFPDCACLPPLLSEDVKTVEKCVQKKPAEQCELKCKEGKKIVGNSFIICQKNFRWSSQPRCIIPKCSDPSLPKGILEYEGHCSFEAIGDLCTVQCKEGGTIIGSDTIKCLNETHWSALPDCTCPTPNLPDDVMSVGDCNNKRKKETCKLRCKGSKELVGNDIITCGENTIWSSLPHCKDIFCLKPNLPGGILFLMEDCSFKTPNETCQLACEQGGNIIGLNFITCLKGKEWSKLPECTCPPPSLNRKLAAKENCNSKKINETCEVECTGQGMIEGEKDYITCKNSTTWSRFPKCKSTFCPTLLLPKDILQTTENCDSKIPNEKCYLICKQGGNFIGDNFVECLNGGWWSSLPDCTCPDPNLDNTLAVKEDCSFKKRLEECKILCTDSKKSPEYDVITCRNDTKWSQLPRCAPRFCPNPTIPSTMKFINDCSSKSLEQICQLTCSEGGKLIGNDNLKCLNNLTWSKVPVCTCPEPNLPGVISKNCTNKIPGESCDLTCSDQFSVITRNSIVCNADTKWNTHPECKRKQCPDFSFPKISIYEGQCENKTASDRCLIRCRQGGKFINERNYIECKKNGLWTKPQKCFCPVPNLSEEYIMINNCSEKLPGQQCYISCKNGAELKYRDFISCDSLTIWSSFPRCEMIYCPPPSLSGGLITLDDNCNQKTPGKTCSLSCRNGGLIKGPTAIICDASRSWSPLPKCTCSKQNFPLDIEPMEDCATKTATENCSVSCKSISSKESITCLMEPDRMWSEFPNCPCSYPTNLYVYIKFQTDCIGMKYFPVGKICNVYCENSGKIFNGTQITCLKGNQWTPSPFCACQPPPNASYVNYENCSATLPGLSCHVSCVKGIINKQTLSCNFFYQWAEPPICQIKPCQNNFGDDLFGYNCTNLVSGDICKVGCKNGALLVGSDLLKCIGDSSYQSFGESRPYCVCALPKLKKYQEFKEDCRFKRKRERCLFGCKNELAYATCIMEEHLMWTPLPECRARCSNPVNLEAAFAGLRLDCKVDSKTFNEYLEGDICSSKCSNGGLYITGKEMTCLETGEWTAMPSCSCPPLAPSDNFEPTEDCSRKFKGDRCTLRCKQRGFRIKPNQNFVECLRAQWIGNPECERAVQCPDPKAALIVRQIGTDPECQKRQIFQQGETCTLNCLNGGMFKISGVIQCLPSGKWSRLPVCSCPLPRLNANLIFAENCVQKFHEGKCLLACKQAGFKFKGNINYIQCIGNRWGNLPVCEPVSTQCNRPQLTDPLIEWTENCDTKLENQRCTLKCKHSAPFVGTNIPYITCMRGTGGLIWSALPTCACINLTTSGNFYVSAKCDQKRPRDTCLIWCIQQKKYAFSTCNNNGQWTVPACS